MNRFIARHPVWSLVIIVAVVAAIWLIFAVWPPGFEAVVGKKKVFLNAVFNGITLGGLYFLVASGFTLIFGLMRNVNLAHGSLYLLGGYVGYNSIAWTGSWLLGLIIGFAASALVGIALQVLVFRRMEGQELRQTMVTLGISIVMADLMLWVFGADYYQIMARAGSRARPPCPSSPPSTPRAKPSISPTRSFVWRSSAPRSLSGWRCGSR